MWLGRTSGVMSQNVGLLRTGSFIHTQSGSRLIYCRVPAKKGLGMSFGG